jgi:hypothetical protein
VARAVAGRRARAVTAVAMRNGTVLRWLAAPAGAAVLVLGVWVAGGLVTDDFRASMALTALWVAIAAAASVRLVRRRRDVGVPVVTGALVAAIAVGTYLGLTTLRDKVVHERVAVGPVQAVGTFRSGEHATSGTARVVRVPGGRRVLTLTGFDTSAGPDLRVRIGQGASTDGGNAIDIGALKGNRGDQQYELPQDVRGAGDTVLIWCRAFSALFGSAPLRLS